jgi:transketolase
MFAIADTLPMLVGASADLNPSTHRKLKEQGDFVSALRSEGEVNTQGSVGAGWSYARHNSHFRVRECAIVAIP